FENKFNFCLKNSFVERLYVKIFKKYTGYKGREEKIQKCFSPIASGKSYPFLAFQGNTSFFILYTPF
ncbi:hypothetical protein, partial [Odoribacter laneus]|uniref:hypothetical protein n=1 Tax=Odoribacter laneus TaxID=626933 RepID=UPI003AF887BF